MIRNLFVRDDPQVQQALNRYQLGIPNVPTAGRNGELLGRGSGSSLEFQEYREYLPGDDLRHVDWSAYARTDTLMVRLFREEISPRTEIILDGTRSMTTNNQVKATLGAQLTALFALLTGRLGGQPAIYHANNQQPSVKWGLGELDQLSSTSFDGVRSLDELTAEGALRFKPQSLRIVISDFLFPHDPDTLVKRLASQASTLWMIQLLSKWEAKPETMGGRRFVDIESQHHADLIINQNLIKTYRQRLQNLQRALMTSARRTHSQFVTLIADEGLEKVCQDELCQQGILSPV